MGDERGGGGVDHVHTCARAHPTTCARAQGTLRGSSTTPKSRTQCSCCTRAAVRASSTIMLRIAGPGIAFLNTLSATGTVA